MIPTNYTKMIDFLSFLQQKGHSNRCSFEPDLWTIEPAWMALWADA